MRQILNPAVIASAFALACSLSFVSMATAQNPFGEDPFGSTAPDAFGAFAAPDMDTAAPANATLPANNPLTLEELDPVVRLLRLSPPKTAEQWADALTWMSRIKRWDEVRRLLDELSAANWTIESKAALARAGGSALWLRLRADEATLTDNQSALVRDILLAPGKIARDVDAIDGWIDQLASVQAGEQKLAQFRLHDGSMVAIKRLVDRLLSGDTTVPPTRLATAIASFGRDGEDALRAACVIRDPQKAGRVLLALAQLPNGEFNAELGAATASRVLPIEIQTQLSEKLLAKYGRIPDKAAVHAYLENRFDAALAEYQLQRATKGELTSSVWRPTPDGQSIELVELPSTHRPLERLAQLASHLANLTNATRKDSIATGASLLQRAYQANPTQELGEFEQHLLRSFDAELASDADYWQQVFARANEWEMHGAALRSLQLLTDHARRGDYLAPLDFLSQMLGDPRPVIRFTALQSIAQIAPQQPFPGAEKSIEVALEMSSLGNGPHALVIGMQSEMRQAASQQLSQKSGSMVTAVNTGREALLALDGSEPIELILLVDRVSDLSVFEVLQRIRNTKKGQSLPIAVLTERLYQHERRLIDEMPGVIQSVLSSDPTHMERVVRSMLNELDTNPMSTEDRSVFAQAGGGFLATIAGDRDTYAFYPISDWRERLISTQGGLPLVSQMTVIAAVGSADGQLKLSNMAATASYSEQQRMAAARAFGQSVKRFGMLMRPDDVLRNYDLYNELGPRDPIAAKALGLILDVTEAQAGKAAWPEGL